MMDKQMDLTKEYKMVQKKNDWMERCLDSSWEHSMDELDRSMEVSTDRLMEAQLARQMVQYWEVWMESQMERM